MKILLAIPSKNQSQYIGDIIDHIGKMSVKPDHVLYFQDRPSAKELVEGKRLLPTRDGLIELVVSRSEPEIIGHPQMAYGESQFLTGYIREQAIDYMLQNGYDAVVFIDGDCLPEPELIEAHKAILCKETPVVTVGQRKEFMHEWTDQRLAPDSKLDIFSDEPREVENEGYFVDSGVVWTCNFGMNRAAVMKLRELNKILYGREETFSSDFVGTWGGEDGFIGLECFYTLTPVIALPKGENGIKHQFHLRESAKYQHVAFIQYLEQHREQLLYLLDCYDFNYRNIRYVPREDILVRDHLV